MVPSTATPSSRAPCGIWAVGDYADFGFGIDSSLTVGNGWDNATGFGTPNGPTFINAVASSK
jgi:hypothetical protein